LTRRVFYRCVLYEDLDTDQVPTDKAKSIANRLDNIGISAFEIVYGEEPVPTRSEQEAAELGSGEGQIQAQGD